MHDPAGKKSEPIVSVNGVPVIGLMEASIATTNCFSADTFSITMTISDDATNNMVFWSATSSAYIEIAVIEAHGSVRQNIITGMADSIVVDPINHTVAVEGRDLSSSLIDRYRQQDFVNQTASEVVAQIAQSHDLTPIIVPTFGSIGRYYGDGYTRLSLGQYSRLRSDWDVVVELARGNNFDAFVQGSSLFFQPIESGLCDLVRIKRSDIRRMRVERTLGISSSNTARVQSWDSQKMASYDSATVAASATVPELADNGIQQAFLFPGTNLTPFQVTNSAERFGAELGRLATVLQFDMPWDFKFTPRSRIVFDQLETFCGLVFSIDSIERRFNLVAGSTQSIRAVSV